MSQKIYSNLEIKGNVTVSNITNATLDTDKFLVSDGGLLKYRTGNEILFDIGVTSGYVPYTGAISSLDLGEYQLSTGQITFDQTPTQTAGVGVLRWNDADGTLDLGLKGGNVTLQLGQEQLVRVVNKTLSNLTEAGYQVVYTSGAQGQRLKVDLALANSDLTSAGTLGIVTENIAVNQEGFVTTNGLVRGINTTGSLQSETWIDGDILYLSPTTAGMLTNIKPIAPDHTVTVGVCVHAHATQGSIFIKVDNGYELEELHNVLITGVSNNDILVYESATTLWKNKSISTILGYTPVDGTGTANYLTKFTGVSSLGDSLIYDNGTNVGVGTTNPGFLLTISRSSNSVTSALSATLNITNPLATIGDGVTTFNKSTLLMQSGNGVVDIRMKSDYDSVFSGGIIGAFSAHPIKFVTNGADRMMITSAGNVLIGTTTDNGVDKLQVNGSGRFTTTARAVTLLANTTDDGINKLLVAGTSKITDNQAFVSTTLTLRNGSTVANIGSSIYFDGYYKQALISTLASPGSTTGGDLKLQTYASDTVLNDGITVKRAGRVLVNTTTDNGVDRFQVSGTTLLNGNTKSVGLTTAQGTTASDTAPLGTELATTGSGSGWTGTSFTTGYTHTTGDTSPLITTFTPTVGSFYQLNWVITGRTAGTVVIQFGDYTYTASASGNIAPYIATATAFSLTPTTTFDGTVSFSAKLIGTTTPVSNITNSAGATFLETRTSTNNTNVFIGINSGYRNTTGGSNNGLGTNALRDNTSGSNNVAFGYAALIRNSSGTANTAIGVNALQANRTGLTNVAVGTNALYTNILGGGNTVVGYQAAYYTVGYSNCVFGDGALGTNAGGSSNIAIGANSGRYIADNSTALTNTSSSIFIGERCKALGDNQSNQIVIGYNQIGLGSNSTIIGGVGNTKTAIVGRLLLGTTTDDGINQLQVTGSVKSTSSVQVGDSAVAASSANVGAIRYRSDTNNSYMDMVMQTGASTYEWVNVVKNTWT